MDTYKQIIEQLVAAQVISDKHRFSAKSKKLLENNKALNEAVLDATSFADAEDNYQIRIMYILNSLTEVPKCKTCGCKVGPSQVYAQRGKFSEYCSRACVNYTTNHEKSNKTLIEKYGTTNVMSLAEKIEKRKQTNREKYGADFAQQTQAGKDKINQSMQERYGVDRPMQLQEVKDKFVATNIERYGVSNPMMHQEFYDKQKQTNIERYGTETPTSTEEVKNKIKQTNLQKYGVECVFSSPEIQQKIKQTNLERYGVDNVMLLQEFKDKVSATNTERYGEKRALMSEHIKEQVQQRHLKKYGTKHPAKLHITKEMQEKLENDQWLIEQHHTLKKTHTQIAKEIGVSQSYLSEIMDAHGIETKHFFSSQGERDVNDFVNSLSIPTVQNSRAIIPPYELDIYVPSHFLAIEYNGLFWHSTDNGRDSTYHLNKTVQCENKGIRLLQVLESEWAEKPEIVKNYIRNMLDVLPELNLEQCATVDVAEETAIRFFDDNHIDGYQDASITIGLVHENALVFAISFEQRDDLWQIVQFCNNGKVQIHLAFEYLVNVFKREMDVESTLYLMDRRWESLEDFAPGSFNEIANLEPGVIGATSVYDCGSVLLLF